MKKPKWSIHFRKFPKLTHKWFGIVSNPVKWIPSFNRLIDIDSEPIIESIPHYGLWFLWWQIDLYKGTYEEWEWYIWVTKYNDGDVTKAMETWPWYTKLADGTKVKTTPWENYRK